MLGMIILLLYSCVVGKNICLILNYFFDKMNFSIHKRMCLF